MREVLRLEQCLLCFGINVVHLISILSSLVFLYSIIWWGSCLIDIISVNFAFENENIWRNDSYYSEEKISMCMKWKPSKYLHKVLQTCQLPDWDWIYSIKGSVRLRRYFSHITMITHFVITLVCTIHLSNAFSTVISFLCFFFLSLE